MPPRPFSARTAVRGSIASLALALALAGCPADDDDSADDDVTGDDDVSDDDDSAADDDDSADVDADGDGYPASEDCDDCDPAANLDDADGDGVSTCGGPGQDPDCDDGDPDNYPGNPEACDGADNDCDGAPEQELDGTCGLLWVLDPGAGSWTLQEASPQGDAHAPRQGIQAGFAVADIGRAWVLTNDTYHVLDTATLAWLDHGVRTDLFPALADDPIHAVTATPASVAGGGEAPIVMYVTGNRHRQIYDLANEQFVGAGVDGYDSAWDSLLAPPQTHIRAAWHLHDNDLGWVTQGNPADSCGAPSPTVEGYIAVLSLVGRVHLYDADHCEEFVGDPLGSEFPPFLLPGAPAVTEIAATVWTGDRLLAFAI